MALTQSEQKLLAEVIKIAEVARLDYSNIEDYDRDARAPVLRIMINQIVRSEILMRYVLIDEFLCVIICHTYFLKPKRGFSFKSLWRSKRFQAFNYFILETMSLRHKLSLVNHIKRMPPKIRKHIEGINAVRNAIAHSFFPENKRDYRPHRKVVWAGIDIFSAHGLSQFEADAQEVIDYLGQRAFGFSLDW